MGKKEIVQAVVLADDFVSSLTPMHDVLPMVLMPVMNVPLLDYLVETLIKSRVQELFLYCSNHVDLIKAYVKENKWSKISVSLIVSDACTSLGDALRDIDTKGSIRGNFILIRGDAFINANLVHLLNDHCSRLEKDKGATMTMVLRNVGSTAVSSLRRETCLVVSDKSSKKILHYSKLRNDEKKVKLELSWFLDHNEIEIDTCFLDTHVYLCSPSVLPLFSDNFDFQTMEDFIRGVLMNEEILNSRVYWQQLNPEDHSLPIVSWNMYHTLNRDILNRHSFPLTPNGVPFLNDFIQMPRTTYKHRTATLAKGCRLEKDSVLSRNSTVGNDTCIARSVIGDHCSVGSNVTIKNAYVLPNNTIEDNCTITNSVIFSNCSMRSGVRLSGCILCPGTIVDTSAEYADSILESRNNQMFVRRMSEVDAEEFQFFKNVDTAESDDDSTTDVTSIDDGSECNSPVPDDTNMFLSEVIDSLLRGFQDKLNCDNLILEINSSRYAYNVTMSEVTYNVIKAVLSLPFHYLSEKKEAVTDQNYQRNLKIMITYFYSIILNYVKTEDAQDDCLRAIEEVASTTQQLLPFLQHLLHLFYEKDVLTEEKIFEWYESEDRDTDDFEARNKVRAAVQPFIKWLEEAEEDSSGSDND
ncbi:translation initiation factor eIF-2B subunit epsilon [Ceratina calcarata]|uniref:Translation initiation factor eIF2B subunit epsilon n=1 Tax=Ceratina calcarata TaxID=156304 RepID=A0AAJ7SAV3_9HYME|nr:translation initiation factor eIF-2B subunit epsilon [Ceratina calcarata]XP_026674687.1 translation initiation factor eIF-2B subunit epsilon [Ceratina calcarata]